MRWIKRILITALLIIISAIYNFEFTVCALAFIISFVVGLVIMYGVWKVFDFVFSLIYWKGEPK